MAAGKKEGCAPQEIGDQATVRLDDGLQVVRECLDRACGSRAGASDSQASVFVRSRTASSSVNESDVGDGDGVKRRPRRRLSRLDFSLVRGCTGTVFPCVGAQTERVAARILFVARPSDRSDRIEI